MRQTTTFRRGAAATEAALLLPFLLLLFAVVADFCRVFSASQALENAAATAALYASGSATDGTSATAEEAARLAAIRACPNLQPSLQADNVTFAQQKGLLVVTVSYEYPLVTTLLTSAGKVNIVRTVHTTLAP